MKNEAVIIKTKQIVLLQKKIDGPNEHVVPLLARPLYAQLTVPNTNTCLIALMLKPS
jgi:hypothetical protein